MNRCIFVAGAGGAIGRVLCRLLLAEDWTVVGTTRSMDKTAALRAMGVMPVVVDVFDADKLRSAVAESGAGIVIHQLTDLPPALDPAKMAEGRVRNARLREIGTRNLVAAAVAAGVTRMVAQSIAFAYAPGPMPYVEDAPLDAGASAVISLEQQVLGAPLTGIVLRYGRFYGPGTGIDVARTGAPVHVDAAADAARRAVTAGAGIYNIAEDDGTVCSVRAQRELGWRPDFRSDSM